MAPDEIILGMTVEIAPSLAETAACTVRSGEVTAVLCQLGEAPLFRVTVTGGGGTWHRAEVLRPPVPGTAPGPVLAR